MRNRPSFSNEKSKSKTESITKNVVIYHIPKAFITQYNTMGIDQKCINLIDTPGFGQSGGTAEDEKVASCLVEMVKELKHLDYICLCVKASENRVSTKVKDLFNRLNKLYATDIADRILGCFTYGSLFSGKLPEPALSALSVVDINLNASDIPRDNQIFLFENN